MREKVEKLLQGKEIHVKTFHSLCAELIKDHTDRCKAPDFKIFEEIDSMCCIYVYYYQAINRIFHLKIYAIGG